MRTLLVLSAASEATIGIALLAALVLVVEVLLGAALDESAGVAVGRLAGTALLGLGVACWGASRDVRSRAATGVVAAMLVYNIGAMILLGYRRCCAGLTGIGLVPAAMLHAALAAWCIACLRTSTPRA